MRGFAWFRLGLGFASRNPITLVSVESVSISVSRHNICILEKGISVKVKIYFYKVAFCWKKLVEKLRHTVSII